MAKKVTKKAGLNKAAQQAYNNELAGGATVYPSRKTTKKKVSKKVSGARKAQNALNKSMKKSKSRADAMKKGNYGRMHYK